MSSFLNHKANSQAYPTIIFKSFWTTLLILFVKSCPSSSSDAHLGTLRETSGWLCMLTPQGRLKHLPAERRCAIPLETKATWRRHRDGTSITWILQYTSPDLDTNGYNWWAGATPASTMHYMWIRMRRRSSAYVHNVHTQRAHLYKRHIWKHIDRIWTHTITKKRYGSRT